MFQKLVMKDRSDILQLLEEGSKCQESDIGRAKESYRQAQVRKQDLFLGRRDRMSVCLNSSIQTIQYISTFPIASAILVAFLN